MAETRLLVLDDDLGIGVTIRHIGESVGHGVRCTTDADEFFRLLDDWSPTHIALDLVMPNMDGVEVLVRLAERRCRARIIITSGIGSRVLDAARRSALERGLDIVGVLSKPFSASALRKLLADAGSPREEHADAASAAGQATAFEPSEADLREAIANRQILLEYQPKIDCTTGRVTGCEALVRWQHPQRGRIMPDAFIALAERSGLIDSLTEHVLDEGLEWFARNRAAPGAVAHADHSVPACRSLAVNVSARTLRSLNFADRMAARCERLGVDPACVIFELTETAAMEDPVTSLDVLTRMRMKGFHLAIDDFGTGYSSMLQLVRLPFSEVKIDRSFVLGMTKSVESFTVVKSIIELAHALDLRCVAEGVEDGEALRLLTALRCDMAQGYFIARPMAGDALRSWYAGRTT